ncbi:MAG: hypothetical protein IPG96_20355 [Proteobacteria bacterium]|nr:hypothetical protein [Pseudomonadota bacterium]
MKEIQAQELGGLKVKPLAQMDAVLRLALRLRTPRPSCPTPPRSPTGA